MALSAACLACLWAASAQAQTFEIDLDFRAEFGLGADPLLTLEYDDGSDQEITAGNGIVLGGGVGLLWPIEGAHQIESLLLFGLKYSTMRPTENADLDFTRGLLDLLVFYRNDDLYFRVGGGASLLAFGSMSGSGALDGLDVGFDPAVGGVVQADFVMGGFHAGLRLTLVQYDAEALIEPVSATSLGVEAGYAFRFGEDESDASATAP